MKISKCVGLLFIFTALQAYGQDMQQANIRKFVFQVLQVYSPTHANMITTYEKAPAQVNLPNASLNMGRVIDYMSFVKDSTRKELIMHSMAKMIREMSDVFSHRVAYNILADKKIVYEFGSDYRCVYINPEKIILIKQMKAFPAKELVETIPVNLRISRFKEDIYTTDTEILAQKMGIYGLLHTWNGYYQATQLCYNLKSYYQKEAVKDIKIWEHFLADYYENYTAYVEFKYYILKYLELANSQDPFLFNYTISDNNFREAFKEIDKNYQKVITDFEKLKLQLFELFKAQGMSPKEVVLDNQTLTYLDYVGIENHKNQYILFEKALQQENLKALEKRIKGI